MFDIAEELKKLPDTPGVYLHKNALGEVIYVGKAINLKRRLSSYFVKNSRLEPKVRAMVANVAEFEYIKCVTEVEALILECNLIKEYMPKYNILMKDDKTYPYIAVTLPEIFPRVIRTRQLIRNGNKYYGPYSDSGAASKVIELIDSLFPIKKCKTQSFSENVRPCLNYHIGKCCGVCINAISHEKYMRMIDSIIAFLDGKDNRIIRDLEDKMHKASEKMEFEEAAEYRDYIKAVDLIRDIQRATSLNNKDIDILVPTKTFKNNVIVQYSVRDGKLIHRNIYYMENSAGETTSDMVSAFVTQHYAPALTLPEEILVEEKLKDEKLLTEFLNDVNLKNHNMNYDSLHKTKFLVPERGEKKALVEMARADTFELQSSLDARAERAEERKIRLKDKITTIIEKACELNGTVPCTIDSEDEREYRIEAYDVSNMNGIDTVSAMVVYEGIKPIRKDYRKFRIRLSSGDDYAALEETINRRMKRAADGDAGFMIYPDIMFIDGGLGQVHAVQKAMNNFEITIPVVGLAKDDSHRTRAIVFEDGSEIPLARDKLLFSYAGTIQEEVHRFAITFQRNTRGKRMVKSVLEEIDGVGPKRRKALLAHFKGIEGISKASYEELLEVDEISPSVAENIIEFFGNGL